MNGGSIMFVSLRVLDFRNSGPFKFYERRLGTSSWSVSAAVCLAATLEPNRNQMANGETSIHANREFLQGAENGLLSARCILLWGQVE